MSYYKCWNTFSSAIVYSPNIKKKVPIQTYTNIQISFIYTTHWLMGSRRSTRERLQNGARMEENISERTHTTFKSVIRRWILRARGGGWKYYFVRRSFQILPIVPPSLLSLAIFCPPSCSTPPPFPSSPLSLSLSLSLSLRRLLVNRDFEL